MEFLQKLIQWVEVGAGGRWVRRGVVILGVLLLAVAYNWLGYRNLASAEAMDMAQVGRNLSQGKGYSTLFLRPLSIHLLLEKHKPADGTPLTREEITRLFASPHPDMVNPPVYPLALAGLMSVVPFEYSIPEKPMPFFRSDGRFSRHQPDFLIGIFNQLLFFATVALVFLLALRLFDKGVAWLTAAVILGTDLFWQFSVSGLSTNLLLLIFVGLAWCLVLLDEESREPRHTPYWPYLMAVAVGLLVAAGALTRYSFGWLIIPVLGFLFFSAFPGRFQLGTVALVAFLGAFASWIAYNMVVTGLPFGIATYAVLEGTPSFPDYQLQRSLSPEFTGFSFTALCWQKFISNARTLVTQELPRLAGSWISAFFLVGLFIDFRTPAVRRLRSFALFSLVTLGLVQTMVKSQVSIDTPVVNGENLIFLIAPLVVLFGVSLFMVVFEQIEWPVREMRLIALVFFTLLLSLPLVFRFIPPRTNPVVFPPYNPPALDIFGKWMQPGELTMSDMPWAMAWYGQRESVWCTLKVNASGNESTAETFFAVSDYIKPVQLLVLSRLTVDQSVILEEPWNTFALTCFVAKQAPAWFPLRVTQPYWTPHFIVLTDMSARMQRKP